MAHYDLEEQEQIDTLKTWWKMYGNLVTGLALAVALGVVGWQGWNWYQRGQVAQASAVFAALEQAVTSRDMQRVKTVAGELTEKYSGTPYASLAALLAAKTSFEAGDAKTAKAQLAWVAENGKEELKDIGRLRLAAVLLDEAAYDEALKTLAGGQGAAFAGRFAELRGDVLAAQGKKSEARAAYKTALESMESKSKAQGGSPYRDIVQQKSTPWGMPREAAAPGRGPGRRQPRLRERMRHDFRRHRRGKSLLLLRPQNGRTHPLHVHRGPQDRVDHQHGQGCPLAIRN